MFMGIGNENVSGRAVVVGHVGTGKTVLTRRFGEDVVKKWMASERSFFRT